MRVFKLLIKILFLATIIAMASLNSGTRFNGIVFCFRKHALPGYHWFDSLLNTFYAKQMAAAKYNSLFTTNKETELKAEALTLLDDWILDEVQMMCDHGAGSVEARTMKDLVRMDKSSLYGLYINGEFERFDEIDNLINYMDHVSVDLNCHNHLKVPSRDGKYLVIFKEFFEI